MILSHTNIEKSIISFLNDSEEVILFSAYIRSEQLKKINQKTNVKQIVVRWEISDLCFGASDLELYNYCKENNIILLRNTNIHLKAFWNNKGSVFFGSANITKRGIGESGNYELNGKTDNLTNNDIIYFNTILNDSEYVDEDLFKKIENLVEVNKNKIPKEVEEMPTIKKEVDFFLLSQLPMYNQVDKIYEVSKNSESIEGEDLDSLLHDIALFNLNVSLSRDEFMLDLTNKFNNHPFILALKEQIKSEPRQSLGYGRVINWIQDNTTTVPTPRSWELKQKQIVNILYEWICYFDDEFSWERPNHSQVIFYNKNKRDS